MPRSSRPRLARTIALAAALAACGHDIGQRQHRELFYRLDGTRFELGFFTPCPANAICIGNDEGTLVEGRIVLRSAWGRDGVAARYERVGD